MSQFIDRLRQVSGAVPQPIGFRKAQSPTGKARMLLVAEITGEEDPGSLKDSLRECDAVLYDLLKSIPRKKAEKKAGLDTPWGVRLSGAGESEVANLNETDCDFIVFPAQNSVAMTPEAEKTGKIIEVETSLEEGLLRAINLLPVDAVLGIEEADVPLTWQQLMRWQRIAALLRRPLIAALPPAITAQELKKLWEAGIDAAIIRLTAGQENKIAALAKAIRDFPPRLPHHHGKAEAIVPYLQEKQEAPLEDEEDEEEEE